MAKREDRFDVTVKDGNGLSGPSVSIIVDKNPAMQVA